VRVAGGFRPRLPRRTLAAWANEKGNVWLEGKPRRVKLLDFGLARAASGEDDTDHLTRTGAVVGTPAYMSPEQARGAVVDGRTDLFSLGCVLYQMLVGHPPFRAPNLTGVLLAAATEDPPRPARLNRQVPPALDELGMRLLAKTPEGRPASAHAATEALQAVSRALAESAATVTWGPERPAASLPVTPSRRRLLIAAAAVLLLTLGSFLGGPIFRHFANRGGQAGEGDADKTQPPTAPAGPLNGLEAAQIPAEERFARQRVP
jgi:hypothetical protein